MVLEQAHKTFNSRKLIGHGHLEYAEMMRLKREKLEEEQEKTNHGIKVMTVDISQSPIMLEDV